jgi:glycerophosphoryl diester phosphodiesterase
MKYFSSLIILFFLMSFMNEGNFQKPAFDVEGHRGCRGLMPENTIPAMLKAIDLGVTTLEMDVVITKIIKLSYRMSHGLKQRSRQT